jgi:hypothetical protein
LVSAVVVGFICQVLAVALSAWSDLIMIDMFGGTIDSTTGFFTGWVLTTGVLFVAWQLGALISLIYYRLSKRGIIIFSAAAIILFVASINFFARRAGDLGDAIITLVIPATEPVTRNTPTIALMILIIAALAILGNFVLIRRAQINAI